MSDVAFSSWVHNPYLDYNRPYQSHLITGNRNVCIWVLRIKIWWFAVRWDEDLSCQVDYMCETAFCREWLNSAGQKTDVLDLPRLPIVFLASSSFQTRSEFLHHSQIVARVVTSDMANLYSEWWAEHDNRSLKHTLCSIPTLLAILKSAWPSRWPLWALLRRVNPIRALSSSHLAGIGSSIQCDVTAK